MILSKDLTIFNKTFTKPLTLFLMGVIFNKQSARTTKTDSELRQVNLEN